MHYSFKRFSLRLKIIFTVSLLILAIILPGNKAYAQQSTNKANPTDKKLVQHGQFIYKRFCSFCHGANLQGQSYWNLRKPDGKLPAPPHDETGHTWHHPDAVLFGMIKQGMVPPYAPVNYKSDMPAWGETLNDDDIWSVLAYIKSRWPNEIRKIQEKIDQDSR